LSCAFAVNTMEVQPFEIKTEADKDITECLQDVKPSTGMFVFFSDNSLFVFK